MSPDAVRVFPRSDFTLDVDFSTGDRKRFDMKPYLDYPAFAPLAEAGVFMKAHIANGVVSWTDMIDLSPDTLWLRSEPISAESDHPAGRDGQDKTTAV